MLQKKYNSSGQKAYQRTDTEDRSLVYRNWLRTIETGGFFLDIDFIKWKNIDGENIPCAITELTRCDSREIQQSYLDAINNRLFIRDKQGDTIKRLGKLLGVPVYLVLFQKEMLWLWVYSFRKEHWKKFSPEEWAMYLKNL